MSDPGGFDTSTAVIQESARLKLRARVLRVEIVKGPNAGSIATLHTPSVRVGSAPGCDLVLSDPTVSRHHCTLRVEERGVRVVDAGSRNGTFVDGVDALDAYARPDATIAIGQTVLRLRLLSDVVELPLSSREAFGGLLGKSVAMREVFTMLEKVAATDDTVLVIGETGTGKELVAEAVHEESSRGQGPFVVFDCSAVAPNLIESELFGHVKGAFTGAVSDRAGAFEAADGGTLFLDEIGELPLDLQPKLLRALERLEIRRVGATQPKRVDVRIVAATNRNLGEQVARGAFREDLLYRLNVVTVELPPLRERAEDIPLLVDHFVQQMNRRGARRELPPRAIETFQAQSFPGNVRELRNAVARALSLGVAPEPLDAIPPPSIASEAPPHAASPIDLSVPLKEARDRMNESFEREYVAQALAETGGNVSRAAEIAGVNRKFIQRVIKKQSLR